MNAHGRLLLLLVALPAVAIAKEPSSQLRYPVAAIRLEEQMLALANERSGTISLVDMERGSVVGETRAGKRLSALAVTARGFILSADAKSHEVVSWRQDSRRSLVEVSRERTSDYPVSIVVSREGDRAYIATRWSQSLDVLAIDASGALKVARTLRLPFAAGAQLLLPDQQHLLVGEAFGGRLAIVDIQKQAIANVRNVQGHNITSLAWDETGDRLLIAHQIVNELPVTLDNVQWGAVLKNVVRIITRKQLLDPKVNLATATRIISLGQEGDGSADPTSVLPLADGAFAVTLGGADELVVVESTGLVTKRLALGRRPIALFHGAKDHQLVAVNHFDSTLSMVNLTTGTVAPPISLGPAPELHPAERGERLFYDARLSFEKWMSCHSCHTHGHTTGANVDTLGDNSFGAPKRTLTLLGTRDTDRWAWNGEIKELHDQVRKSIETSMHGEARPQDVYDLTAYLHTLDPPPPASRAKNDEDRKRIDRGRQVFERQRCHDCHIGPLTYTSHDVYDVGLADKNGQAKFNPPSLRGVVQGSRFFHDGRATSLEDVIDVFGHQLRDELSDTERADLLRFLRSL